MDLLSRNALAPVFQPMVDLRSGMVLGQEALARPPKALADTTREDLWKAAERESCLHELEVVCMNVAMQQWTQQIVRGKLFVNFSAGSLVKLQETDDAGRLLQLMHAQRVNPKHMGLDISGYSRQQNMDALLEALHPLRAAGVTIALDNFNASDKSMKAWTTLMPHMVKMAPRWTHHIDTETEQSRMVRSLVRVARSHNAVLVAKSVETETELLMMKALDVDVAQGFFLGSPSMEPARSLNLRARGALGSAEDSKGAMAVSVAPMDDSDTASPVLAHRYSLLR
jgi:EAL domain-containing protein (putative c-di-GMP-specific phosphodiesterase class I)